MVTYHIYRGIDPQKKIYLGSATGSRIFNDTHLPFNTTYQYCITAENTAGESLSSPLVSVTTRLSPTAQFSIYPHNPRPNESILFVDSSLDLDGSIINWTWQFTPGGIRYGKQVHYVFPHSGTYTVTLTVMDTTGDKDTAIRTLSLSTTKGETPGFTITVLVVSLAGAIFLYTKKIQK
jgi:PKD repeat protein